MVVSCAACIHGDYRVISPCDKCNNKDKYEFYPHYYKHTYTVEGFPNIFRIDDDDIEAFNKCILEGIKKNDK